jgi:hypothetical protein
MRRMKMTIEWRRSCPNAATCVEVAMEAPDGEVWVRDSKDGEEGPILAFTRQEWEEFLAGVKAGEFDGHGATVSAA